MAVTARGGRQMDNAMNAWFLRAYHDLEYAELMIRAGRTSDAFLSCHRATERILKGLWVAWGLPPPADTHDVAALLEGEPARDLPVVHRERIVRIQRMADTFDSPLTPVPGDSAFPAMEVADLLDGLRELLGWVLQDMDTS